ncbi:2OG-Fe dioxygenase family protein [Marinomonas sp. THO17]|uniref:2OG-Fe dioxygenase family protein n=1 Tax=Marinomonas sp. THO17 TaxID=3149048 RepID=UPI00336C23E9
MHRKQNLNPSVSEALKKQHYALISGEQVLNDLQVDGHVIEDFCACWDLLTLDKYMGDGGTYRYRRYGQFLKSKGNERLTQLPHEAYVQPAHINYLNGDIERHFDPLTKDFIESSITTKLLTYMCDIYDEVEGQATDWNIRLHPYRILANRQELGKPTPEGLHRDGVTYIATLLINRVNIVGGKSILVNNDGHHLIQTTLEQKFDLLLADDEKTLHKVTPIIIKDTATKAYRDVLVIAFTKLEAAQHGNDSQTIQ